jgi:adenine/guanine phosphoribosyltransferase-like PRPP-binding protein
VDRQAIRPDPDHLPPKAHPDPYRLNQNSPTGSLKRILGHPASFAFVVDELARTVPPEHAIVGCDEGAWALAGALALRLAAPAVLIRRVPKTYFVSYGDDPSVGDGRLVGERLPAGTAVHLIDDLIYSGHTLRSALDALEPGGLTATSASAIPVDETGRGCGS